MSRNWLGGEKTLGSELRPLPQPRRWGGLGRRGSWACFPLIRALTSALFLSVSALRSMEGYSSPSVSSLVTETILVLRTPSEFSLQALRYWLRRVWERRPRVPRAGWLCCCSCAQC